MIFNMVGGGGGSSTKSTIIVSIDTGSTVGIYDSTYTTLIKSASEKTTGKYWLTGLANGTYYIKATKGSDVSTTSYTITEYGVYRISMAYRTIPEFTYTGSYEVVKDDDTVISDVAHYNEANWKIRFLTSGTLNFANLYGARNGIDVFLVGGGASGRDPGTSGNGGGGGGGYTTTALNKTLTVGTDYTIIIGDGGAMQASGGNSGGTSTAFNESAAGGETGTTSAGGAGGSGGGAPQNGSGGSDGANGNQGSSSSNPGGTGQGTTTREFGEANATLYSGGGGAGGGTGGSGGDGGGGHGASDSVAATAGETNTGGGGGGGHATRDANAGGSGIVIIRNARS